MPKALRLSPFLASLFCYDTKAPYLLFYFFRLGEKNKMLEESELHGARQPLKRQRNAPLWYYALAVYDDG